MKIIISPAKKMAEDTDSILWKDIPHFLSMTDMLRQQLQGMSKDELQKLWKCNDKIADLNFERLKTMDLTKNLTPAVLAYEGIQYQIWLQQYLPMSNIRMFRSIYAFYPVFMEFFVLWTESFLIVWKCRRNFKCKTQKIFTPFGVI